MFRVSLIMHNKTQTLVNEQTDEEFGPLEEVRVEISYSPPIKTPRVYIYTTSCLYIILHCYSTLVIGVGW